MPSLNVREMLPPRPGGYKWQGYQSVTIVTGSSLRRVTFLKETVDNLSQKRTDRRPSIPVMVTTRI